MSRLRSLSGLLVVAWFFAAILMAAPQAELGFDPAYHASVAKSFALGQGWATHYEHTVPFNPDVTTGPTLLLPAALLIRVFGPALWVPAVSAALTHLTLFALILWRLRRFCPDRALALAATLCILFVLYAQTWWVSLTADFAVLLLLVLTSLLVVEAPDDPPSRTRPIAAGLSLGAALLAKSLAWFGVAGLLAYALIRVAQGAFDRSARQRAALLGTGLLVVLTPWALYQHLGLQGLDPDLRAERAEYARRFFLEQGSGLAELAHSPAPLAQVAHNLPRNAAVLAQDWRQRYGMPGVIGLGLLTLPAVFVPLLRRRQASNTARLLGLLGLIGSGQALWFLLLSQSWSAKYALAPTALGLIAASLWLAQRRRLLGLLPAALLALALQPAAARASLVSLLSFDTRPNAYMRDLAAVREYLLQHPPSVPLAGCGWVFTPWETEYALPGVGHFRDCRRLIRAALVPEAPPPEGSETAAVRYRWAQPVSFVLVVNHFFWRVSAYRDQDEPIQAACARHPLLERDYFSVLLCTPDALQAALPLDRPAVWLPTHDDGRAFVHKPAPLPAPAS